MQKILHGYTSIQSRLYVDVFFGKIVSCFVDFGKVVEIKMEYYFVAHSVSEVLSERNARNDLGKAIWTIYARKEALDQ